MAYSYTPVEEKAASSEWPEEFESAVMPPERPINRLHITLSHAIVLAVLSLGWILLLFTHIQPSPVPSYSRPSLTPLPPSVFEVRKKTFNRDERYVGFTADVNRNWDHLVAGHDALWIEDPDTYGLGDGEIPPFNHPNMARPPPKQFYVVSVLHQLHCLNMVRVQYFEAYLNITDATPNYSPHKWAVHVEHCFEYLRQAISCGSLFAIEGDTPLDVKGEKGHASTVTGWGVEHDCFNFEALRVFQIEQEGRYNATWMRS